MPTVNFAHEKLPGLVESEDEDVAARASLASMRHSLPELEELEEVRLADGDEQDGDQIAPKKNMLSPVPVDGPRKAGRQAIQARGTKFADSGISEEKMKKLETMGLSKNHTVDLSTLVSALEQRDAHADQNYVLKRVAVFLAFFSLLLLAGMFCTSYLAIELAKETRVSSGGSLQTPEGNTVRVGSQEFAVADNGLLSRRTCENGASATECARRLAEGDSTAVATQVARKKRTLHSALPDSFFDSLDEITIHSEKGHKLSLKIHGYARIPVLNSRCGNILRLFTAVDGHLSLDSTDLSFSGQLEALFKNAGFEVVIGGASGRRLSALQAIDGFFNHISDMAAEGSWTCQDVPLPKMPKFSFQNFSAYMPCSAPKSGGKKVVKHTCDSIYGGVLAGVGVLPEDQVQATLSRLDRIRALVGHDLENPNTVLYARADEIVMRSPSWQVQRSSFANHPSQELIDVVNKVHEQGVGFQRVVADADEVSVRNFCQETNMTGNPVLRQKSAENDEVNNSIHFEFIGLVTEGGKTLYRHFRMMPADAFLKWMGSDTEKRPEAGYYEYWDHADTLEPHRLLTPDGTLVVYHEVRENLTDEEVEVFLKTTVNGSSSANADGSFAYRFECEENETGPWHPQLGKVPEVVSADTDVGEAELDFYARLLLDRDTEDEDGLDASAEGMDVKALDDQSGNASNDTNAGNASATKDAILRPAWSRLSVMASTHMEYEFAQYALKSKNLFAMPDGCAEACDAHLVATKAFVQQAGEDKLCDAPSFTALVQCLAEVPVPLGTFCAQSPFMATAETGCRISPARRMKSTVAVETLPDGTSAVDLGRLDPETRLNLAAALAKSVGDLSFGDLSGVKLLYNSTQGSDAQAFAYKENDPTRGHAVSRRLGKVKRCDGFCIFINVPWSCEEDCRFKLEVSLSPTPGTPYFALTVELGGSVNLLETLFGIPNPPVYGSVSAWGGLSFSNRPACPNLPFTIHGYAGIGAAVGVNLVICSIDLLSVSLEVGAKTIHTPDRSRWERTDRRRRWYNGWGARRRRAAQWKWHSEPARCDVEVYGRASATVFLLKGWLKLAYQIMSKYFVITAGVDVYIPLLWWGWWEKVGAWNLLEKRVR
eukprot:TRINITY_DN11612_c0_g1_i1.p1 TRINITY_DN11612_c0_g1~~TRINITY_DN11612_c0_g1_i1.p1  ORF type:complete len:1167 (-),score=203.33 TRINITY_DN11612_c0_g1_i1:1960-5292(-)